MQSSLVPLSIGLVGVSPRLLFLNSQATDAQITAPGFINPINQASGADLTPGDYIFAVYEDGLRREIFVPVFGPGGVITLQGIAGDGSIPGGVTGGVNLGTGQVVFAGISGTDLSFKTLKAGGNIVLTPSATELLITATQKTESFVFENTFFVAKGGMNSNSGTDLSSPLLTIQAAIDLAELLPTVAYKRTLISVMDSGTYSETVVLTKLNIDIIGPNASLDSCTFTLPGNQPTSAGIHGNNIEFNYANFVTYIDSSTTHYSTKDFVSLKFKFFELGTITLGNRSVNLTIDCWNAIAGSQILGNMDVVTQYNLNIGLTQSSVSANFNPLDNIVFNAWENVSGNVGNVCLNTGKNISIFGDGDPLGDFIEVDPRWHGNNILMTPGGNPGMTTYMTVAANNKIQVGFQCRIIKNTGTGIVGALVEPPVTLLSRFPSPRTNGDGGWYDLRKIGPQEWFVGGDIIN